MKGKFLAHRTVAPRLSELFNEAYEILKMTNPEATDFSVLIRDNGKEIQTRIVPMTSKDMDDIFEVTQGTIGYIAHTDESNNFISGEEK